METMVELTCATCGTKFKRRAGEVKRNIKRRRKTYCNISCSKKSIEHLEKLKKNHWTTNTRPNPIRTKDEFSGFRWYLKNVKKNSKKRQTEYNIDIEYLKQIWEEQEGICPLTGWKLILKIHINYRSVTKDIPLQTCHASLDRIDSNKGYIKGNVRFIAVIANYAKSIWNDDDLIEFCHAIVDNE